MPMLEPLLDALGFDCKELWLEPPSVRQTNLAYTLRRRCWNLVRRRRLIEALRLRVEQCECRARRLGEACPRQSATVPADHENRLREIEEVRSALARHHLRLTRQERRYQEALAQVRRLRQKLAAVTMKPAT
jgi:hypothetical protein